MKVIVLTGGGTSGHVTPNIALMSKLEYMGYTIHYIGSRNGIEKQLIEKEGIVYHEIDSGKLRRYPDIKNITDLFKIVNGLKQSIKILNRIKPDVVFSKGGFVSCPVVWAAWLKKIPVIIHESDITPGLTNKLSIPFAKKVCYTFPETEKHLPMEKACLTGLPVREEIVTGDRLKGCKICGFTSIKPVILVIGGSQGSENINRAVRNVIHNMRDTFQVCHICGKGNVKPEMEGIKGYKQFEYVNKELPDIFACADIFISRAGATVLFEILALKKPALLIPLSKNASRGDQILNAESFRNHGYSDVLREENLTGEALMDKVKDIYNNREMYIRAMKKNPSGDAVEKVADIIKNC